MIKLRLLVPESFVDDYTKNQWIDLPTSAVKKYAEAQLIVLEVVKEYKKSDEYGRLTPVTTDILKELIMTLEVTFLEKKLDHVIHNFLK